MARLPKRRSERDPSRITTGLPSTTSFDASDFGPVLQTPVLAINTPAVRSTLSDVEDRRYWHPDRMPSARSPRQIGRLVAPSPARDVQKDRPRQARPVQLFGRVRLDQKRVAQNGHLVKFKAPKFILLCVRRKARRQVLFAKNKTGMGSRSRYRKHNSWSKVGC